MPNTQPFSPPSSTTFSFITQDPKPIVNIPNTHLFSPPSSTTFSSTTPDPKTTMDTAKTQLFGPPSSKTFTFTPPVRNPYSASKDTPIPSIEVQEGSSHKSQDGEVPKFLASRIPYGTGSGILEEDKTGPPVQRLAAFRFGESKESSPFTFRKMHNATPEPPRIIDHSTFKLGHTASPIDPAIKQQGEKSTSGGLKASSAAMSGHSDASSLIPGSNVTQERIHHNRYDVKDERPPDEPYFDKQFQKALQKGKQIASKIKATLQECELAQDPESQIYGMIQTASELQNFDAPTVCTIGIVGDSGAGE
jgi:hypothetical protein